MELGRWVMGGGCFIMNFAIELYSVAGVEVAAGDEELVTVAAGTESAGSVGVPEVG